MKEESPSTTSKPESILTIRLFKDHANMLEKIKSMEHIQSSSKAILHMIERYVKHVNQIEELQEENRKLQQTCDEINSTWRSYRRSMERLDMLSDG